MRTNPNALAAWVRKYAQVSESTLALTFAEHNGDKWRFNTDEGMWLEWVGSHWARSHTPELLDSLRNFLMEFALAFRRAQRMSPSEAVKLQSQRTLAAVEKLCRTLPAFLARSGSFDGDPFALGTPGGTIDLRTGEIRKADPGDMITVITKVTPAPPGTPCPPRWQAFMDEVMAGNRDLQRMMQQWAGCGATGSVRDQRIMFIYGSGRNGKGVYCRTITELLGDHVAGAQRDLFMEQGSYRRHSTDLSNVVKARMVLASEIPEGGAWDVALIKELTGGDVMEIRLIAKDPFKVKPRCTVTIMGNHKPELKSVDEAVRGRFLLVTFPVFIPEERRVADLEHKFVDEEGPAILRWIIDGAVAREIAGRLHVAEVSRIDTTEYFADEDFMTEFLATYFKPVVPGSDADDETVWVKTRDAFEVWRAFCGRLGRKSGSNPTFTTRMKAAGVKFHRTMDGRYFTSIRSRLGVF